jgi:hypothetical protein
MMPSDENDILYYAVDPKTDGEKCPEIHSKCKPARPKSPIARILTLGRDAKRQHSSSLSKG